MALTRQHTALAESILQDQFGLQHDTFVIKETKESRHNFVYWIDLSCPPSEPLGPISPRPFTCPIPSDTSRLIFRLPRGAVSLEESVRIRNEVAFLSLGRNALYSINPSLISQVFDWADGDGTEFGNRWILQEWKEGQTLSTKDVESLDDKTQRFVLDQIAAVLKAFQDFRLPESVKGFGGLTFDEDGVMTSTKSVIPCGGPFSSYSNFLRGMLEWQLEATERSSHLRGWREYPELRKRLQTFFSDGLEAQLARVPEQQQVMVHGDLALSNMLFDTSTYRLSAVLDFDFSHLGAPISEYFFSFWDIGEVLPGRAKPEGPVRDWLLSGFPESVDPKFELLRVWDYALNEAGVQKPSTIHGAGHVADLWWFSQELCQAFWFTDRYLATQSAEQLEKFKTGHARYLERALTLWGF